MGPDFDDDEYLNSEQDYTWFTWDVLIFALVGLFTGLLILNPVLNWLWGFLQYAVPHHQN